MEQTLCRLNCPKWILVLPSEKSLPSLFIILWGHIEYELHNLSDPFFALCLGINSGKCKTSVTKFLARKCNILISSGPILHSQNFIFQYLLHTTLHFLVPNHVRILSNIRKQYHPPKLAFKFKNIYYDITGNLEREIFRTSWFTNSKIIM